MLPIYKGEMTVEQVIQSRINQFKSDLSEIDTLKIIRKYIISGDCFIFDEGTCFEVRADVADHFRIHPNEIVMVGSAKLGFTIKPQERYRPFNDRSDIDLALVSPTLFDRIWKQALEAMDAKGYFWKVEEKKYFQDCFFKGWIRPDLLPSSREFTLRRDWREYFQKLTSSGAYGPYKLSAGLYREWHFLENYQSICVKKCRQERENNDENNSNE